MAAKKSTPGERVADRTRAMNNFIAHLKHPLKAEISAVRGIIMQASPKVAERVKWESPSFYFREDLATFDLESKKSVHLVLLGEQAKTVPAPEGLTHLDHLDRRAIIFRNLADIAARKALLTKFVRDWVDVMEQRPAAPAVEPE